MKYIELTQGKQAIVDNEDLHMLSYFKWNYSIDKRGRDQYRPQEHITGSYTSKGKSVSFVMSRIIMNAPENMVVDHINGNTLDNRKCNLRICTNQENIFNSKKRKNTSSIYKGVSVCTTTGLWKSRVMYQGKEFWIGRFDNEVEAAEAYDKKAMELFGEFARLNFTPPAGTLS